MTILSPLLNRKCRPEGLRYQGSPFRWSLFCQRRRPGNHPSKSNFPWEPVVRAFGVVSSIRLSPLLLGGCLPMSCYLYRFAHFGAAFISSGLPRSWEQPLRTCANLNSQVSFAKCRFRFHYDHRPFSLLKILHGPAASLFILGLCMPGHKNGGQCPPQSHASPEKRLQQLTLQSNQTIFGSGRRSQLITYFSAQLLPYTAISKIAALK